MENFTLSMSIQNLPQETLKLTTKVPEKLDAFLFWGFFWDGILSDTNYSMNGNSYPIVPYSYISERLDADQRLTIEAQRRAIEVLKEKRDLRSIVPWWKPSVWGDFRKTWGSAGCCRYMRELILCRVFFWVSSLVFCWKWRSPSRLKIWETGDFHLTSLSSILIGRALEITRMSVFQWAFFIFPNRTFWSSGAYLHHPLSCVWGSKLSIYKLSEVHWVHGLVTSLFFFKGMICDEIFSDLSSVAGWCKYAFRFPIYEDIRRFWVFKVQDPYCWWRSND